MSLNIRYLTNGKKAVYCVRDSLNETLTAYDNIKDNPEGIRHYAPKGEPTFAGPDLARILGFRDILYPNFPGCGHPDYVGRGCIAESCQYAGPNDDYTQ